MSTGRAVLVFLSMRMMVMSPSLISKVFTFCVQAPIISTVSPLETPSSVIASAVMGVSAALVHRFLLGITGNAPALLMAIIIAVFVFYGFCRVLRLREIDQIVGAMVGKFRR